jgi:hypothetical protein
MGKTGPLLHKLKTIALTAGSFELTLQEDDGFYQKELSSFLFV